MSRACVSSVSNYSSISHRFPQLFDFELYIADKFKSLTDDRRTHHASGNVVIAQNRFILYNDR